MRKQGRFSQSRSAVVHRCIGDFHTSQFTNQSLVFINYLEISLGHFRLIRCIGSGKFRSRNEIVDYCRDEMIVRASTEKTHMGFCGFVLGCQFLEHFSDFQFRKRGWKFQFPFDPNGFWNALKQFFNGGNANGF